MKAKHIAAVSCAALIALAALPLTGCKGGAKSDASDFERGELDLSKYAAEYKGSDSYDAYTEALSLGTQLESVEYVGSFIVTEKSGKFSVYTGEGVSIETGLSVKPSEFYEDTISMYLLRTQSGGKYNFYTSDGFLLYPGSSVNKVEVTRENKYIGDDDHTSVVWAVSQYGVGDSDIAYYKVTNEGGKNVYTQISADDINNDPPLVSIGGDYYGLSVNVYSYNSSKPVLGEATKYSYVDINDTRIFYKDGQETGRIDMYGVDESCFVGNYLYYTTNVMCDKDSDSANLTVVSQYGELKYEYRLNKYDFVNNSHFSYSYNAVITDMTPLYNKTDKTYDAIGISYMPVKNGVVQSVSQSGKYAVMDGEFRLVGETLTSINSSTLYKFDDDTYGYGSGNYLYFVDKSLTPIAKVYSTFTTVSYYKSAGLISFTYNGRIGFTGLDGKVKIEPKYKSVDSDTIVFYGEYALVKDADTDEALVLKNDGTVTEIADRSITRYGGWYTVEKSTTLEVYSLDGTLLKSVSNCDYITVDGDLLEITDSQGLVTALLIK